MEHTREIKADRNLVAYCGLYCGACRSYLKGKCPGCKENAKATWCKVRTCCIENNLSSCADCKSIELPTCKKQNNMISKIFGLLFNSDRAACVYRIRQIGLDAYAEEMAQMKRQSIKRKG